MKDDYESFVEDSEFIIEQLENGDDVSNLLEDLKKRARNVDARTIPTSSFDPIFVSTMIEDLVMNSTLSSTECFSEETGTETAPWNVSKTRKIRESPTPSHCSKRSKASNPAVPAPPPKRIYNCSFPIKVLLACISVIVAILSYYLYLPSTCPKPIW